MSLTLIKKIIVNVCENNWFCRISNFKTFSYRSIVNHYYYQWTVICVMYFIAGRNAVSNSVAHVQYVY